MRADRLVATLLLLQTRGRVTAAELAAELEVSVKTARRDLEALSMAGIPVYSQPGRGGGWELLGGGRTDLSGLTAAEAEMLFLIAGPASSATPQVKSALRKLFRALPAPFRAGAEAASQATVLDPAGWGKLPPAPDAHMDVLQRGVIAQVQVSLAYTTEAGVASERLVHPLGLAAKGGVWYLVADTARGRRTFRVDRIARAELTGLPAERPPDFDLASAWRAASADIEQRRQAVRAHLLVWEDAVSGLRVQFGADVSVVRKRRDGRVEVRLSGGSVSQLAEQLAGWGDTVAVRGPASLRRQLGRIGAQLVAAYGEGETHAPPGGQSGQKMS